MNKEIVYDSSIAYKQKIILMFETLEEAEKFLKENFPDAKFVVGRRYETEMFIITLMTPEIWRAGGKSYRHHHLFTTKKIKEEGNGELYKTIKRSLLTAPLVDVNGNIINGWS